HAMQLPYWLGLSFAGFVALCLFIGATGKSAQVPLYVWLPAALAGAPPVLAPTIGVAQYDIKRVLAYSTVSQLGFMFLAAGTGAYAVAIFHLMTHAFFKALLFLDSGSVIHAMSGEQDMRRMGGLKKHLPITYW